MDREKTKMPAQSILRMEKQSVVIALDRVVTQRKKGKIYDAHAQNRCRHNPMLGSEPGFIYHQCLCPERSYQRFGESGSGPDRCRKRQCC